MRKTSVCILLAAAFLGMASLACDAPNILSAQRDNLEATETIQALATRVAGTLEPRAESGEATIPEDDSAAADSVDESATLTPTVSVTPTLGLPIVHVSVDTNCRFGPGSVYEYEGALLVGEEAVVTGKLADESFWYIENPDAPPPNCWIWGAYASVTGDKSGIPILTPPPTPTETPIPMDFSVALDTAGSCATWGVFIYVENIGSVAFKSSRIKLTDTDLGETMTTDMECFPEIKACLIANPPYSLPPGASSYLGVFGFSANPTGHDVQGTIRLCTEDGLGGDCVQKSVSGSVPSP